MDLHGLTFTRGTMNDLKIQVFSLRTLSNLEKKILISNLLKMLISNLYIKLLQRQIGMQIKTPEGLLLEALARDVVLLPQLFILYREQRHMVGWFVLLE